MSISCSYNVFLVFFNSANDMLMLMVHVKNSDDYMLLLNSMANKARCNQYM